MCSFNISKKVNEKVAAVIVCVIGTVFTMLSPTAQLENFLYFIGSVFAPMVAILITDYFILRKDSTELNFDKRNLVIWLLGFILLAGKKANEVCHPVLLDPVGVGASVLRTQTAYKLLDEVNFTVIRGNISEIKTLFQGKAEYYRDNYEITDSAEVIIDGVNKSSFATRYGYYTKYPGSPDALWLRNYRRKRYDQSRKIYF